MINIHTANYKTVLLNTDKNQIFTTKPRPQKLIKFYLHAYPVIA